MAILHGFAARCLFGVVFLHNTKQGRLLCVVSAHKSKNSAPIRHENDKSFLRPDKFLISSPRHEYCNAFLVGKTAESFRFWAFWRGLRKLDDCALRGERAHFKYAPLIG